MKVRLLSVLICAAAASLAHANAGLTSAGVDPNANNPAPQEPTLAQVAPVTPTGTAVGTAAGTTVGVPGTVVATPGTTPGTGANAANAAPAPVTRVVTPPPPLDPATLPVSVIRPINKAPDNNTSAANAAATPSPEPGAQAAPVPREHVAVPSPAKPNVANVAASPRGLPQSNAGPTGRAESSARSAPPPVAEEPPDTASSNFIFYSGSGIAAFILLLSTAAFLRGRNVDAAPPRR